jgi:YgiT-type zinc finger domain-containing protein
MKSTLKGKALAEFEAKRDLAKELLKSIRQMKAGDVSAALTASEQELWTSKWHGKPCPICGNGILKIGTKDQVLQYKGRKYASVLQGAFCDQCDDGFPEHDPQEQEAWIKFRDSCG